VLSQDLGPASDAHEVHVLIDSNDSKNHRYLSRVESIGTKLVLPPGDTSARSHGYQVQCMQEPYIPTTKVSHALMLFGIFEITGRCLLQVASKSCGYHRYLVSMQYPATLFALVLLDTAWAIPLHARTATDSACMQEPYIPTTKVSHARMLFGIFGNTGAYTSGKQPIEEA